MASSQTRDFGTAFQKHDPSTTTANSETYNTNPPANSSQSNNPSATGPTGSTTSNDPVISTYGNTHSTTGRANPIHPSDPQSTAHPAYGNSSFSSPYETAGGNAGQGDGEGAGAGVGGGVGNTKSLSGDYHKSVDGAYGHATGANPPAGYGEGGKQAGPYDTAGGNSAQTGSGETSTHMGGTANSTSAPTEPQTTSTTTGTGVDNRSTGSKVKEIAHDVKGMFAAAHGAGESARGTFNAGVDRRFNESTTHNDTVAREGREEMVTGNFGERMKVREGVLPGDSEVRRNREL